MKASKPNKSHLAELDKIILGPVKENFLELGPPTKPKNFPDEPIWHWIRSRSLSHKPEARAMAQILNRVLTNQQHQFLLSRRLLAKLIRPSGRMNAEDHRRLMDRLLARMKSNQAFLIELQPSSRLESGKKNRAGLYTLSNPSIISLIPWWNSEKASQVPSIEQSQVPFHEFEHEIESEYETVREHGHESENEHENDHEAGHLGSSTLSKEDW